MLPFIRPSVPLSPSQDSDHHCDDSTSEFEPSSTDDDSSPDSPDLLKPNKKQKTARDVRDGTSVLGLPGFSGAAVRSRASQPRRPLGPGRGPAAPTSSGARPTSSSLMRQVAPASSVARPASAGGPTLNGAEAAGAARRFGVGMGTATGLGGASSRGRSTVTSTEQGASSRGRAPLRQAVSPADTFGPPAQGAAGVGRTAGALGARGYGPASIGLDSGTTGGSGARVVTAASTAEYLHRLVKPATPLVKAALCGMLMSETAPSMFSVRTVFVASHHVVVGRV